MRNYIETTYRHYSHWSTADNFTAQHQTPDCHSSSYRRCDCHQYWHYSVL